MGMIDVGQWTHLMVLGFSEHKLTMFGPIAPLCRSIS